MTNKPYLKALFRTPDLFVGILDHEGRLINANDASLEFIKRDLKDIKGDKFWETPWWDHSKQLQGNLKEGIEAAKKGEAIRLEANHFSPEGEKVTVDFILRPVEEESGATRLLALGRDISKREEIKNELKEREKKYREIFNNANDAVYLHEVTEEGIPGEFIEVNAVATKMLGYTRKEFLSMSPQDIDGGEKAQDVPIIMEELLSKGHKTFEMYHQAKNGSLVPVDVSSHVFEMNGKKRVISIAREITKRKELEKTQKLISSSLDQASLEVYWITPDGRFVYTNKQVRERLGYSKEELENMSVWEIDPNPEHAEESRETRWSRLKENEVLNFESIHKTKGGDTYPVEIASHYIQHGGEEYEFAFAKDITKRKKTERRLKQSRSELRQSFVELAETTSRVLGVRDPYTRRHELKVGRLAMEVGERMDLDEEKRLGLYLGGVLHDIGKIAIPETILTKPGGLKDIEWKMIKSHPEVGYNQILSDTDFPWPVAEMTLHHHERLDGSGYPHGLAGDELSLEVRILGAVDVLEAMSTRRPYRAARSKGHTLKVLKQGRGEKFDLEVVNILVDMIEEGRIEFGGE
ncbi:PAS domain S-box protein [Candidatus Bipolaricaulota bacterium]|nr:PAS domain S-box protein [Candidatus Bipolaricaulota bacterium]